MDNLQRYKENFLKEISTKWDSTFNDSSLHNHLNSGPGSRKSKNRSIYGQPHLDSPHPHPPHQTINQQQQWKSLDSLEYNSCDSSHYSFGGGSNSSNSTSLSDLKTLDFNQKTLDFIQSDLGTSLESFEHEEPEEDHHDHQDHDDHEEREFQSINSTTTTTSSSSSSSSSSGCSLTEETTSTSITLNSNQKDDLEAKLFMKQFVEKIFKNSSEISLEEKSKFGFNARLESGRIWFARYINKKRNEQKCVPESTFYSLAQYFAIILFECSESDDFQPAKILMNMCFTYYHHTNPSNGGGGSTSSWIQQKSLDSTSQSSSKQYLYSILRDQPIWKLIRFWQAAFFDAIQCERLNFYENSVKKTTSTMETTNQQHQEDYRFNDWQFHANLTFGQLGTFTYNMYSFGLSKEFCWNFLQKQSTIANLTFEQIKLLQDNIESMYNQSK